MAVKKPIKSINPPKPVSLDAISNEVIMAADNMTNAAKALEAAEQHYHNAKTIHTIAVDQWRSAIANIQTKFVAYAMPIKGE